MYLTYIHIILFVHILIPSCDCKFYIGRYKTVPVVQEILNIQENNEIDDKLPIETSDKTSNKQNWKEVFQGRALPKYITHNKDEWALYHHDLVKKQGFIDNLQKKYGKPMIEPHPHIYKKQGYPSAGRPSKYGEPHIQPHPHSYNDNKIFGPIDRPTLYQFASQNQNNKYGYTTNKKVNYVVPPFTPGGRVNVAFQFWVPLSVGGFFVSARELEEAMSSKNPNSHLARLFIQHLTANLTSDPSIGDYFSTEVFDGLHSLIEWAMPETPMFSLTEDFLSKLRPFSKEIKNTESPEETTVNKERSSRRKREILNILQEDRQENSKDIYTRLKDYDVEDFDDVLDEKFIYDESKTKISSDKITNQQWSDDNNGNPETKPKKIVKNQTGHNIIERIDKLKTDEDVNENPLKDLENSIQNLRTKRSLEREGRIIGAPRPFRPDDRFKPFTRPFDDLPYDDRYRPDDDRYRPDDDRYRPYDDRFQHEDDKNRPDDDRYHPNDIQPNFPDISLMKPNRFNTFGNVPLSFLSPGDKTQSVSKRLSNLDYYFRVLNVRNDCEQKILCQVIRDTQLFFPLSDMFSQETSFQESRQSLERMLRSNRNGQRMLSYVEAKEDAERSGGCDVYRRHCREDARDIINRDFLAIWREFIKWITVALLNPGFAKL